MNCRVTGTHDDRSNALIGLKLTATWMNGGTPRTPRPTQCPAVRNTRSWMSAPLQIPSRPSRNPSAFGPAQAMNAPVSGKRFEVSLGLATSATRTGAEQRPKATSNANLRSLPAAYERQYRGAHARASRTVPERRAFDLVRSRCVRPRGELRIVEGRERIGDNAGRRHARVE